MSEFDSPDFDIVTRPKQEDVSFDLASALGAVVSLTSRTPENAFTAQTLGTERAGNGVLIRDDGLLIVGAEYSLESGAVDFFDS